jgi:hypothetical protein
MLKQFWRTIAVLGYAHECIHFGAARSLGVSAKMHSSYTEYFGDFPEYKRIIIALAPFTLYFTCLVMTILLWVFFRPEMPELNRLLISIMSVWGSLVIMCIGDLIQFIHFVITGNWNSKFFYWIYESQQKLIE